MAAIKPIDTIVKNWVTYTPARSEAFLAGVRAPRTDWASATIAAAPAWASGVAAAAAAGRFGREVTAAGTPKWQTSTIAKAPRWAEGVRVSEAAYRTGFTPYVDVIRGVTLPPRGPVGDPANIERVRAIATALHDAKLRGS